MKNWIIGISILLVFAAAFYLLRGCYSPPSRAQDATSLDSLQKVYTAYKNDAESHLKQLTQDSSDLQNQVNWLMAEHTAADAQLVSDGNQIGSILSELHAAQVHHDTVAIATDCDTLASEVQTGKIAVAGYRLLTDSLVSALQLQGSVKDSTAAAWHSLFLHADTAVNFQTAKYNALYSDYTKVGKKLKLNQFLTKGLAGAIVVVLIGAVLKK